MPSRSQGAPTPSLCFAVYRGTSSAGHRAFRRPRPSRIRGAAADEDEAFVAALAATHDLPFHLHRADAPAAAATLHETLEEAARNLRYAFFRELIVDGSVDAVATAHTLDDQAETVLHRLLRGAWTEGLSGIHPVLPVEPGSILRPFLDNIRATLEAWLLVLQQPWREDSSNQDLAHTRNRIRWQLLPLLRTFNPQIAPQLARLASISARRRGLWQQELSRLLPPLLLPGRPTRGGGRSASTHPEEETVAIEYARLRELHPAVARRVVRAAARRLGARLNFEQTEQLLAMVESRPSKFQLPGGIMVERSLREIRLSRSAAPPIPGPAYTFPIPGEVRAPGIRPLVARRAHTGRLGRRVGRLAVLEGRRPGNTGAQPGSQESCRGSGSASRPWRSAKKLAGG